MLVLSMKDQEKWDQIKAERKELFKELRKMSPFIRRYITADQSKVCYKEDYPYFFSRKFVSKFGNKKFLVVKIANKRALKDFIKDVNYSIRSYTLLDAGGKGTYVYNDVQQVKDRLEIYIPHYWSRYRERMKIEDNLSFYDLLVHHYKYNSSYSMTLREVPNLKQRENGFFATSDSGISWGIIYEGNVYKFNTFITADMMKGEKQKRVFLEDEVRRLLAVNWMGVQSMSPVNNQCGNIMPVHKSLIEVVKNKRRSMKKGISSTIEVLKKDLAITERERRSWWYKMKQWMKKQSILGLLLKVTFLKGH